MQDVVLKTHKLTKVYGKQIINNDISITIRKGEIYGLIGKNGAGKTTLIRMITGLAHKSSGEIELFGKSGHIELDRARTMIGSLIEMPAFYGDMTARENLEVSRLVRNIAGEKYIDEVLELVGLHNTGKKKVKNFSLGMKQRLGIANALLGNPRILILDEPINGLDPMGIVEIRDLLIKVNKEKDVTILISSHILGELSEIATSYGFINNGELIKEISAKELEESCKQYIELEADDITKVVTILEREIKDVSYEVLPNNKMKIFNNLEKVGYINYIISTNGVIVEKIGLNTNSLEGYFMDIIGGTQHA
ncbi:ATP-binding cassette domain-containing protein [Romboutsia weinsteinii]|uniref:ATP-binding cassette domain-containing protein n=1 Tax=Romboutsia weinsteinii TaxID=2020949 RepID=A0A371J163_9FIRM|nr:ATP-binding cassette domain-containing protein [Romboutsia weinsteinii]RDY26396.1 ATP-binding cassette domain-containing protein [Romboutsia weinsteinii]